MLGSARLGIADQTVHPGVGDADLDPIFTGLQRRADIDLIWRVPCRPDQTTVHADLGNIADASQIERLVARRCARNRDARGVARDPREIAKRWIALRFERG
ncbi:hypothetical protein ABG067_009196, partial [Albugo candida]